MALPQITHQAIIKTDDFLKLQKDINYRSIEKSKNIFSNYR